MGHHWPGPRLLDEVEVRAHLGDALTTELRELRLELILDGIDEKSSPSWRPRQSRNHRRAPSITALIALAILKKGDEHLSSLRIRWTSSRPSPARNAMGITGSSVSTRSPAE